MICVGSSLRIRIQFEDVEKEETTCLQITTLLSLDALHLRAVPHPDFWHYPFSDTLPCPVAYQHLTLHQSLPHRGKKSHGRLWTNRGDRGMQLDKV